MDSPNDAICVLKNIFKLCDVNNRGQISVDDLVTLAEKHVGQDTKNLNEILRLLDPLGYGSLSFEDFCRGVSSLIKYSENPDCEVDSFTKGLGPLFYGWDELTMTDDRVANELNLRKNSDNDTDSAFSKSTSPDSAPQGSYSGFSSMSEREVSFEGYGEADEKDGSVLEAEGSGPAPFRNSWMRNSLRRNPISHGEMSFARRWGSLRIPNKRGLTSSYKSAAMPNGDAENDFYSDASLEEDVNDLNHKVHMLQEQISALASTQNGTDDRYNRTKQENAALTAKLQMLEESLRDMEIRAQQQLAEEQRRNKELIGRVEREKQLELENCNIKLQGAMRELDVSREEVGRLKAQADRIRGERTALQQRLEETETNLVESQEELRRLNELSRREREEWALEHATSKQLIGDLSKELESIRQAFNSQSHVLNRTVSVTDDPGHGRDLHLKELETEIKNLKQENKNLREANEELQAQLFSRGLEEGRTLLSEHPANNSLAAEFEAMSQDDIRVALREQQEVNAQLRTYIEGILLTIVENQPQLLERKTL